VSIQDEIFKWVQEFEPWKQELFLRASASPELSESDIREVAAMLLGDSVEGSGPREVTRDDLPGAKGAGEPMAVRAISDIVNVNALANGEKLPFESQGINIVYGKNGAGKTGYSRILKHAGRTLHPEAILTNIAEDGDEDPSATISISIGDKTEDIPLNLEEPAPALLGRICIADSKAGEEYLTSETEVDYVPVTLASLRRLSKGLKALDDELRSRQTAAQPSALDLRPFGETRVAQVLRDVSSSTSDQTITNLAGLSEEEEAERLLLRKKHGEIEARQAPKLRVAAERDAEAAERLAAALKSLGARLASEEIEAAHARLAVLAGTRKAAELAAARFEEAPLPGVGSDPWRELWRSASEFAKHIGQELPSDHDPARCPLCMQALAPDARQRLEGFKEFVAADVNSRLREAERAAVAAREALPDIEAFRAAHSDIASRLGTDPEEPGHRILDWLDRAEAIVTRLRAGEVEGLEGIDASPVGEVEAWAADRRREAREHAVLEQSEDQEELKRGLDELEARFELDRRREEVLAHLAALREVDRLGKAKAKTGTGAVSNKMTTLSRDLVEADLQGALNSQLRALNFQGLAVEAKLKTVGGTTMFGLRFKSVDDVPLTSVLSQGEQRRLGLAMFLAEMEVISDASPIVLDDPVCSVDQEGRRHIACTLVRLAADRQLIVFTHELSFIRELERQAPPSLPIHAQQVRRIGKTVGHVDPDLPWEGLKARQRLGPLHEKLNAARALYESGDEKRYKPAVIEFCVLLRGSFERAVEEGVLAEIVTRREDNVRTTKLREIVCTEEICVLVDRGTDENSAWVHDQPTADGADPPTPDELREGLDIYDGLLKQIKAEHKKRSQQGSGKLTAVDSPPAEVVAEGGTTSSGI
jgi:hypothetical protein